ncbi:complex I NDUFA9 subunit family protein [Ectothiorhodospiraceae bacterium 2226]|nr:complex I NDUFA9 subunit family protein [Ectothiorhodospiraceae bacterium 2226]
MKPRTVCILGGTGFVGRHLVGQLFDDGYRVKVLTRNRERHRELLVLPTVDVLDANVHDPDTLRSAFAGQDVVINLVGILNERRPGQFRHTHVELTRKVIEACRAAGVKRLLHMSALGADPRGPSEYQRTKGEAEELVRAATDLQPTIFRPSVIFGEGDSFFNRFAGLLKLTPFVFPLACPNARFAPVYVGDVAHAYRVAVYHKETPGQTYELCGPRAYTLRELVEYTAQLAGRHRYVLALGDGASRLQARIAQRLPGKPFSMDNYHSMQRDNVCDGPFPAVFGIAHPTTIEARVPLYLAHRRTRDRLTHMRRTRE